MESEIDQSIFRRISGSSVNLVGHDIPWSEVKAGTCSDVTGCLQAHPACYQIAEDYLGQLIDDTSAIVDAKRGA